MAFTPSKRALVLQESAIRKLDLTVMKHPEVRFHRVNIGQPDVPTPKALLDAIASFQPKVLSYGPASGTPGAREAAAAYQSRWSAGLTSSDVVVTTGGSEALLFAFTAIGDPGDEILVPEPYYTNYNGFATVAGMAVAPVTTSLSEGFAIPPDEVLDTLVTPRTKAFLFSNPSNPTGAVYGPDEVERLVRWTKRRGLFLIADEVYRQIWFDRPPTSALLFEEGHEHVIAVDSMSKTWSACGLRLGFLVSRNAAVMEKVERLGQARLGPQPLAQAVALAGLGLEEAYYEEVRATYKPRVETLYKALSSIPGVKTHQPAGAFYLMADLPVRDADAFARWLVTDFRHNNESVVVAPGTGFYANPESGRRQVRLAAVIDQERLARVGELLGMALADYLD